MTELIKVYVPALKYADGHGQAGKVGICRPLGLTNKIKRNKREMPKLSWYAYDARISRLHARLPDEATLGCRKVYPWQLYLVSSSCF